MMFGWAIPEEIPIQETTSHLIHVHLVRTFGILVLMTLESKIIQLKLTIF